jgi:TonB family protein
MRSFIVILFLAFFTNLDGQALKGRVLDKSDNTPIADVQIKLIGKSASTKTNADGDFDLFISLGYPCLVEFSRSGYQTHVLNLDKQPEEEIKLLLASLEIKEAPGVLKDLNTYDVKSVDSKPIYPGCELKGTESDKFDCFQVAVAKYISNNTNYPKAAKKKKLEEVVIVGFEINFDGKVTGVEILRGRYDELNSEAMRVVWSLPIMTPAKKNGENVKVSYQVPVQFSLK